MGPGFLDPAIVGGEWSALRFGCFNPGERAPDIHCIGGWVGPRTRLDDEENRNYLMLPGLDLRPFCLPALSSRYTDPLSRNNGNRVKYLNHTQQGAAVGNYEISL
jgi:hypothetical protein